MSQKKALCLRIEFDKNGKIAHIGTIDTDLATSLRKYDPHNGYSFPAFNMSPLYGADKSAKWSDGVLSKLEKCLHTTPKKLKEFADKYSADVNTSVYALLRILPSVTIDSFRKVLMSIASLMLTQTNFWIAFTPRTRRRCRLFSTCMTGNLSVILWHTKNLSHG